MAALPSASKSVAFVLPNGFDLGGVTTWSLRMAGWLQGRGYDVSLLSHTSAVRGGIGEVPEGATHRPVGARSFVPHEAYLRRFLGTYQEALPGTVIPNYSVGAYAALAWLSRAQSADLRTVGIAHADAEEYYAHLTYYEAMIHAFVAVSETVGRELRARLPHRAEDIHVRACAVPVPRALDRDYTPPGAPLRLAYAGRLEHEQKRVLDLIALAEALYARGVPFRLDLAGEGPADRQMRATIRSLAAPLAAAIECHGQIPNDRMAAFWDAADICVLTSSYEGTSVSMLEAMGQGCVPVVTAVSGTKMVVRSGENGYVVPVGDIEAMADAIAGLAADRARFPAMGAAAHAAAHAAAASGPYVDWMSGVLGDIWSQPPRPWPAGRPVHPPSYRYQGVPLVLIPAIETGARWLQRFPNVHRWLRAAHDSASRALRPGRSG